MASGAQRLFPAGRRQQIPCFYKIYAQVLDVHVSLPSSRTLIHTPLNRRLIPKKLLDTPTLSNVPVLAACQLVREPRRVLRFASDLLADAPFLSGILGFHRSLAWRRLGAPFLAVRRGHAGFGWRRAVHDGRITPSLWYLVGCPVLASCRSVGLFPR
ncbi:hypothetical protein PYCCODRAFT_915867 [Trametes coccinea BRFM310]|uniref:Uncharacterized protein n=1 Tax=Trametes coccinea (strain BRFM310) TaxID=1353009 RepID=A0A1Y2ICE0_TRAC3|nr:hypothetical protein PYCCODRAFT_915867 [Trametes coccinea BRFM310]